MYTHDRSRWAPLPASKKCLGLSAATSGQTSSLPSLEHASLLSSSLNEAVLSDFSLWSAATDLNISGSYMEKVLENENEGRNLKSTVSEDCNYTPRHEWIFPCLLLNARSLLLCASITCLPRQKTFALVLVAPLGSFFDEIRPGSWTLAMSLSS